MRRCSPLRKLQVIQKGQTHGYGSETAMSMVLRLVESESPWVGLQ